MNKKQKKVLVRIIIAAVLMIVFGFLPVSGYLRFGLYMIPYLVIGYDILRKAWKGILNRQMFDENFLMAVATIGAIVLGEYTEGVAVMLFYQIGELFQSYAVGKSRRNISELMDIRPDYANIEGENGLEKVDPDEVEIGSIIVVQPGEKVPIDGVIVEGEASLNTSALTGESLPREAKTGDAVISGCIDMTGVLKIRTTKEFGESTVSKILDMVENSSSKKSRSENFISKFARYYTPAVCYGALALAVLPSLIQLVMGMTPQWSTWIYRALCLLVISCPCALVISTPVTVISALATATRCGLLIKGGLYLEEARKLVNIGLDKTGTLTRGTFAVTAVLWLLDWNFLAFLSLVLFVFCVQFFRDPARELPTDPKAVLSPVDGRVCKVQKAQDPLTGEDAMMISIFMNVFNVHSQKSPVAGRVEEIVYKPGLFLNADLDKASTHNERNAVRVTTDEGRSVTFVQVAGLVARRILCYAKVGERLEKGERYGFIRFGSRVDVYLPLDAEITVSIGDKVTGVMSTIARL